MWVVKSRPVGVAREGRAQEDAHGVRIAPQRQTEALRGSTAPGGRQNRHDIQCGRGAGRAEGQRGVLPG